MEEYMLALFGAILAFMFGLILAMINRNESRAVLREEQRQKTEALREAERDEREMLILESLNANFSITKELTDCVLYGKPANGELEEAYKYKQETKHKLESYMRRRAAR